MTRLTHGDIRDISSRLNRHDQKLRAMTGKSMAQIAVKSLGAEDRILEKARNFSIHVIPVTAGQGVITDFSRTVCAIVRFLGFKARVADEPDVRGLANAFEQGAKAVMMADDHQFAAINLETRKVSDNAVATGRVFAAALELMAGSLKGAPVLILGCGPVGLAAARYVLEQGGIAVLFDTRPDSARQGAKTAGSGRVRVLDTFPRDLSAFPLILEATPSAEAIPEEMITDQLKVAAPGVPLGLNEKARARMKNRLVHDKLELGVAAMAVDMMLKGGY